jgi:hypothetical protein
MSFAQLDNTIDNHAKIIADELAQRNIYDPKEFQSFLKTRLYFALEDLVKIETSDLELQRNKLKETLLPELPIHKKREIENQLSSISSKLKRINRVRLSFRDYDEYKQLQHFLDDKFGHDVLVDFYENYLNRNENNLHVEKRGKA